MNYCFCKPSALLSPYVKQYWMIENVMPSGQNHIQRVVPTGLIEVSFYLGDSPDVKGGNVDLSERAVVTGPLSGYFDLIVTGKLSLFSIYFYPHGLAHFLNIPISELRNCTIPLNYLLGAITKELEEQLQSVTSFEGRIMLAESFLLKQLGTMSKDYNQARIFDSIALINQTRGRVAVDELASSACLSRKQFERIFKEQIGTSPKQFLKVVRFQNALSLKTYSSILSLTELATESGYFDQSHMNADFISLSGYTPKRYFQECEPVSDYF